MWACGGGSAPGKFVTKSLFLIRSVVVHIQSNNLHIRLVIKVLFES